MCGIIGIRDFKNTIPPGLLENMRDTMAYRGPDDAGAFSDQKYGVALGHRRLSFLDLSSAGKQPMSDKDGKVWITFNGEIYNFKEIRSELEKQGIKFRSNSDTEVMIESYKQWGITAIKKFRGMFAFGIWDREKNKLIICRDRAGVKPLYYYYRNGLFVFASEIKAIIRHPSVVKEIEPLGLASFFQYGYIISPYSIFKGINKLEAASYLEIDGSQNITQKKYWDVLGFYSQGTSPNFNPDAGEDELVVELENILTDSFKLRLVADLPVGLFLSGGIDSTLVAALLKGNTDYPLQSFTVGFNESRFDESSHARKIAHFLNLDHHEITCSAKDALAIIPELATIYDEPFGDDSAIPTYLVSNFAKKYVKTALSADGGDEIFAGYNSYQTMRKLSTTINGLPSPALQAVNIILDNILRPLSGSLNIRSLEARISKIIDITSLDKNNIARIYSLLQSYWYGPQLKGLIRSDKSISNLFYETFRSTSGLPLISRLQVVDFKTYLCDDILVKTDRATMAASLEGRDPFLDQNIIEFAAKLPLDMKYRNGVRKYILKKILYKYIPQKILERPKKGFAAPIASWLQKDLAGVVREYINESRIKSENVLDWASVRDELDAFYKRKAGAKKIWLVLMFEMWYEKWMRS